MELLRRDFLILDDQDLWIYFRITAVNDVICCVVSKLLSYRFVEIDNKTHIFKGIMTKRLLTTSLCSNYVYFISFVNAFKIA